MSQRRGTATDKLANVIQVIQLGRKTGLLSVERGEGSMREEGTISFVQGQIIQIQGGNRDYHSALRWLNSWGACLFTFVASGGSERNTGPLPRVSRDSSAQTTKDTNPFIRTPPQIGPPSNALNENTGRLRVPTLIPKRTFSIEEARQLLDRAGLSRTHRNLLLLIDGRRDITELMRLMGRRQDEVQKLLRDLEYIGAIQYYQTFKGRFVSCLDKT